MGRHAFLLLALFAIAARAAVIVDRPPADIKDVATDTLSSDKTPTDQASTINDVDNKLRDKINDIPVEVVVDVQPALKTGENENASEEIIRQPIDLKNPGPPQRQEHETQNPEFYAAEQQIVQVYKQNVNDAQTILKQGFQSVNDGLRKLFDSNEQTKAIQQSIQTLQEDFTAQINKLNETIQTYLQTENPNPGNPVEQQTKAGFKKVEFGLNALKNDFNNGVKTLHDGVEVFSFLKMANVQVKQEDPNNPAAPANPQPANIFLEMINRFQNNLQNGLRNITQTVTGFISPQNQGSGNQQVLVNSQADTPSQPELPSWIPSFPNIQNSSWFTNLQDASWLPNLQNFPNLQNWQNNTWIQNFQFLNPQNSQNTQQDSPVTGPFQNFINMFQNVFNGGQQSTQVAHTVQPVPTVVTSPSTDQVQPQVTDDKEKPATESGSSEQPAAATPIAPIRQMLQNNPISQGIANVVQKLQNINNPEKPRKPEEENVVAETVQVQDPKGHGGHRPGERDNNGSGVEASEPVKEIQNETAPEVQEPTKSEQVNEQTEQVVVKTE